LLFALFLVFFNQSYACGENGRKSQKKTAERWAKLFRDDSGEHSHAPAEQEANPVFIPLRLPKSR